MSNSIFHKNFHANVSNIPTFPIHFLHFLTSIEFNNQLEYYLMNERCLFGLVESLFRTLIDSEHIA